MRIYGGQHHIMPKKILGRHLEMNKSKLEIILSTQVQGTENIQPHYCKWIYLIIYNHIQ